MFINDTQKEIQDCMFKPRKYIGSRGPRVFSLLPLYDCKPKPVQIYEQALWNIVKFCTSYKESISEKPTDDDPTTWY